MPKPLTDAWPEERESTRIRAFLAKVMPLNGGTFGESNEYWEGRSLIEGLALAFDLADEDYHWDTINCATVLGFLSGIQPVKGSCFCHDNSDVNLTCGFHAVLGFMADELRLTSYVFTGHRPRATTKRRKRAVKVAP